MATREKTTGPLSREAIVAAAMALADADGVAKLSMRAVARTLGVEAMSLYHHIPNKEAILDAMVDEVFAEIHTPVAGGDWRAELRHRCVSARAALKRHPWAVGLMDSRRNAGYETLKDHDAVLGCLFEAGFSLTLAGHAFATIDAYLYGFMVQDLEMPFEEESELEEIATAMLAGLPEEFTHLRRFTLEHALQPGYDFGNEFGYGLDLVLDSLADRLDEELEATASEQE